MATGTEQLDERAHEERVMRVVHEAMTGETPGPAAVQTLPPAEVKTSPPPDSPPEQFRRDVHATAETPPPTENTESSGPSYKQVEAATVKLVGQVNHAAEEFGPGAPGTHPRDRIDEAMTQMRSAINKLSLAKDKDDNPKMTFGQRDRLINDLETARLGILTQPELESYADTMQQKLTVEFTTIDELSGSLNPTTTDLRVMWEAIYKVQLAAHMLERSPRMAEVMGSEWQEAINKRYENGSVSFLRLRDSHGYNRGERANSKDPWELANDMARKKIETILHLREKIAAGKGTETDEIALERLQADQDAFDDENYGTPVNRADLEDARQAARENRRPLRVARTMVAKLTQR